MYLTEELFESADADRPYHSPSKQMDSPHHAHQQHSADSLGKRKRNGDEYTTNTVPIKNMKLYSAHHHHHPVDYPPPHHLYPSPPRRKPRAFAQPRPSLHPRAATYPRPTQMDSKTNQPRSSSTTTTSPPTKTSPTTTKADLTPCHSCHRAPKQKTDLDNYDDCAACAGRTCYICMRMCSGPRCGGRKICRACCLEKGEEGETWCFACEQGNVYEGDGDGAGGGDQDVIME